MQIEEYIKGSRLQLYHSADPYMRAKAACDLSHLRLLHRLVAEGQDAAIIIEDDALLLQEEAGMTYEILHVLHSIDVYRNVYSIH